MEGKDLGNAQKLIQYFLKLMPSSGYIKKAKREQYVLKENEHTIRRVHISQHDRWYEMLIFSLFKAVLRHISSAKFFKRLMKHGISNNIVIFPSFSSKYVCCNKLRCILPKRSLSKRDYSISQSFKVRG